MFGIFSHVRVHVTVTCGADSRLLPLHEAERRCHGYSNMRTRFRVFQHADMLWSNQKMCVLRRIGRPTRADLDRAAIRKARKVAAVGVYQEDLGLAVAARDPGPTVTPGRGDPAGPRSAVCAPARAPPRPPRATQYGAPPWCAARPPVGTVGWRPRHRPRRPPRQ